ncbi:hypothetical protein B0H21DRAFT_694529 [Amylocystis lapponica]|nr:hypothetical protein B0H21DRAFT_694529 [Amylocystis lapponica]
MAPLRLSWSDLLAVLAVFAVCAILRLRARTSTSAALRVEQQTTSKSDDAQTRSELPVGSSTTSFSKTGGLPDPDPLLDFDLGTAKLRDYVYANKTLRYPYFQTMAHQPMHINHWIEIDSDYRWYLDEKARVIKDKGKVVLDSLPDNDDACGELLEVLVDYLPKRFPTLFALIPPSEKRGPAGTGTGIWNKVTDERFPAVEGLRGVDALRVVARLVQDDFLMARERDDGKVYLVGGQLAFPGNYLLSEKIGQPLHALHDPVPHFNAKLLLSVERTLVRFAPDRPFERSSWMIVDDRNMHWHNIASHAVPAALHPGDLYLRMDHQTFRKLPRSGGIMFGVHPVLTKIAALADSPLVPALVAKLHTASGAALLEYKGAAKYADRLVPYLHALTQRQIERGLIRCVASPCQCSLSPESRTEDLDDVAKFRERLAESKKSVE